MPILPANRLDLVAAYAAIAVGAWMIAFGLAGVGDFVQHAWMPAPYLLLPISLVSFYFLPLLAIGVLSLAVAVSGWRRSVTVAAVLVGGFQVARLLYWWSVARQVAVSPDSSRTSELLSGTPPTFWATSLIGVAASVALIRIAVRTFNDLSTRKRPNPPLQPTSGSTV